MTEEFRSSLATKILVANSITVETHLCLRIYNNDWSGISSLASTATLEKETDEADVRRDVDPEA